MMLQFDEYLKTFDGYRVALLEHARVNDTLFKALAQTKDIDTMTWEDEPFASLSMSAKMWRERIDKMEEKLGLKGD